MGLQLGVSEPRIEPDPGVGTMGGKRVGAGGQGLNNGPEREQ